MDVVFPLLSQDASSDFDPEWLRSLQPVTFHHHGQAQGEFVKVHYLLGAWTHTCTICPYPGV